LDVLANTQANLWAGVRADSSSWRAEAVPVPRISGVVSLIKEVAQSWKLDSVELAHLLAYPSSSMAEALLSGRLTFDGTADRNDRAGLMYGIHETLHRLFVDPDEEGRWMRKAQAALGGLSALVYMIDRRIPGMVAVKSFVELRLAHR
jgi:hypothetical protein